MAVARYISLTKLISPLLAYVDEGKLSVSTAADCLSDLAEASQNDLVTVMNKLGAFPTLSQLTKIKQHNKAGTLTIDVMEAILSTEHPATVQVVLKQTRLRQYFPQSYTAQQMEEVIVSLLETWKLRQA